MNTHWIGLHIKVSGIVQGVGFRPFIFNLAERHQLTGWVRNTSSGVEIEIAGSKQEVEAFTHAIRAELPPLARIDHFEAQTCPPGDYTSFTIHSSQPEPGQFIPVSPDMSICPDCTRELFDPGNRRYRYPFINCTNCGPRFTIIKDIPYDRPQTTMAGFPMCPDCLKEYENPRDRRFHAQPIACPQCGPQIWFEAKGSILAQRDAAMQLARQWLANGKILAIKGLGGFHLACDATNPAAITELRRRKKRSDKAFALMAFNLEIVSRHCIISAQEREVLLSRQRPVVLLNRLSSSTINPQTAPGQNTVGIMLAYTPLHLLLLEPAPDFPELLVMTSGNLNEEPIAYTDVDARERLAGLADGFLFHDRPIHMRVDDSVLHVDAEKTIFIRRARGYAPDPLSLPFKMPPILAAGAELKNTFCLTRERYAFLSHHIGDLENLETLRSFEEGIAHLERLFRISPQVLACDLHPDYLASRYARQRAEQEGLPLVEVQHHHAHLAACLADNGWNSPEPVIGLTFDGTGYGTDGAIWGGEVLYGGYTGFQRLFHLAYVPQPGGDLAVHRPSRMALAHLWQAGLDWEEILPPQQNLCYEERLALTTQLEHHLNAPLTSSMGRLFDAVSALLGIRQTATYEGQAAIEMEALADPSEQGMYSFEITGDVFDPTPVWIELLKDWHAGVSIPVLAGRFHNSVANLCTEVCQQIKQTTGCKTVALSGGVWQNRLLLRKTMSLLQRSDFMVLTHQQVPANDGCIALGQALVAGIGLI